MKKTTLFLSGLLLTGTFIFTSSCKHHDEEETPPPTSTDIGPINSGSDVKGYGILSHLPGIWDGPVTSSTPLGGYPEWIVDFRPISGAQVSAKNELDSVNDIYMSYFIVKHGNAYKMAFRNGGGFAGNQRTAYEVIDSVSETTNHYFYRFSDFRAGMDRVYSTMLFKDDSLIMTVYTNKYNTLPSTVMHMQWKAKLQDATSAQPAITAFSYPQKQMVKDFSTTFEGAPEAIYFNSATDPYDESAHPYLGKTTVNISFSGSYTPDPTKKVFLMITTQPLFSGFTYLPGALIYRSRYVYLSSTDNSFTFNYMHPGTYYLYTLYDTNGDGVFSSGDWMANNLTNTWTLSPLGTSNVNTLINYTIP